MPSGSFDRLNRPIKIITTAGDQPENQHVSCPTRAGGTIHHYWLARAVRCGKELKDKVTIFRWFDPCVVFYRHLRHVLFAKRLPIGTEQVVVSPGCSRDRTTRIRPDNDAPTGI